VLAFHDAFVPAIALAALGVVVAALLIDDKEAAGTMRQVAVPATSEDPTAVGVLIADAPIIGETAQPSPADPPE
jgi:hypothetical protein